MVVRPAVNRKVAGSSPALGAMNDTAKTVVGEALRQKKYKLERLLCSVENQYDCFSRTQNELYSMLEHQRQVQSEIYELEQLLGEGAYEG
jgi:hypothetical protein